MSHEPRYVLLTVISGDCSTPQQRFTLGSAEPALSVGARADWTIAGEGISDLHLMLDFDGSRVRAAAASEATRVEVEGTAELGLEWRELEVPFELRFGSARVAGQLVGGAGTRASGTLPDFAAEKRQDPPLAAAERRILKTQLLGLSLLRPAALDGRAPASEGNARPSVGRDAAPFQVASGTTLMWSLGTRKAKLPSGRPARAKAAESEPPVPALDCTVCDGGALRDYARQLAASASEPAPPAAQPEAPASLPRPSRVARARSLPSLLLCRLRALPVRRRWLAMPLLASLGVFPWLLGTPSAAQMSPAAEATRRAPTPSAAVQPAEDARARPAAASSAAEVLPAAAAPPAPAAAAQAEMLATNEPSEPSAAPSPRSRRLEQDAFRAAFSGSTLDAAALYEELAQLHGDRVFEHAARLARQNRVHKP